MHKFFMCAQVLRIAERVSAAMAKLYMHTGAFAACCNALQLSKGAIRTTQTH